MSKREREEAIATLRESLSPGDTLTTVLRHVSRSGMTRDIDVYKLGPDGRRYLSYWIARALDCPMKGDAVRVGGAGMDMGFHLVYSLSTALFPDGFDCIGDRCPSNDHFNRENNAHHRDGGYALRQEWL